MPDDPLERLDWTQRVSHPAAYRELYGYDSETDAIGPEPVNSPEAREAWFAANSAINRTDEAGLDALSDGELWLRGATYERETAWAPPYAGGQLRQARDARLAATIQVSRARAEAEAARRDGDLERAGRHDGIAAAANANGQLLDQVIAANEKLAEDYREWSDRTAGPRMIAVQAQSILQRRHPEMQLSPLKSAEPEPLPDQPPAMDDQAIAEHIAAAAARRAAFREALDDRAGVMIPAEDPDYEPDGEAWPAQRHAQRGAILQPPVPVMPPAPRLAERELADREAGI